MAISSLRLLPPFAIARFGSSPTPLEAYELEASGEDPLDFKQIRPATTLEIDEVTGCVNRAYTPERIRFKDGDHVRPVAPFLEVFAQTDEQTLEPLTLEMLTTLDLAPDAVTWTIELANLKVFRQTGDENDKVKSTVTVRGHDSVPLQGRAENFLPEKSIPLGRVRYIRPTADHPEIRLRFTPPEGRVYGTSPTRFDLEEGRDVIDPVFESNPERLVYDAKRGKWLRFEADSNSPTLPNPSDIYQGFWPDDKPLPVGWGYLDDVSDGRISVSLRLSDKQVLTASAWISACMPVYAPDSEPVRTVADELEQLILGPTVGDEEISIEQAAEIVRRALDTVRLMNTAVMNANTINGRDNIASTLYRQDTNDYGRRYEPAMASSLVDNLAVRALHERIYAALLGGSAPWFAEVLRQPEEIGDLSDKARRKMPPMLRGADGRALVLTRRQISRIVKAAAIGLFDSPRAPGDRT